MQAEQKENNAPFSAEQKISQNPRLRGRDFSDIGKNDKPLEEIFKNRISRENIKKEILKKKKKEQTLKIYSSPYAYIYADYIKGSRYEKEMRIIENRLTDLGISGKIHRLSQFKDLDEMVRDDIRRGISNIVVVGDDEILKKAIGTASEFDITLGVIPISGRDNKISSILGIPEGSVACDTLSQRLIEKLDIGNINGKKFFSRLFINHQKNPLLCDKQYEIFCPGGDIFIYNLNLDVENKEIPKINPHDGRFEILVKPKIRTGFFKKSETGKESLFFAKKLNIKSSSAFSIYVDGKKNFYKNVDIKIESHKLRVIVGKNRKI